MWRRKDAVDDGHSDVSAADRGRVGADGLLAVRDQVSRAIGLRLGDGELALGVGVTADVGGRRKRTRTPWRPVSAEGRSRSRAGEAGRWRRLSPGDEVERCRRRVETAADG